MPADAVRAQEHVAYRRRADRANALDRRAAAPHRVKECAVLGFDSHKVYIGGAWRDSASIDTLPLINPSDGSELARIARGNAADIDAAVRAARAALDGEWGALAAAERGRVLARIGQAVLAQADELARLEAL